jgi:hypothetical protein
MYSARWREGGGAHAICHAHRTTTPMGQLIRPVTIFDKSIDDPWLCLVQPASQVVYSYRRLSILEHQKNETAFLFVTTGSRTKLGGLGTRV